MRWLIKADVARVFEERLNEKELPEELLAQVLDRQKGPLVEALLDQVERFVELQRGVIVREVTVDRDVANLEMIRSLGRTCLVEPSGLPTIPRGEGSKVKVFLFRPKEWKLSGEETIKVYGLMGLRPADVYSLAAVNKADPTFADQYPNITQWRDGDRWRYVRFDKDLDERRRMIINQPPVYYADVWYAGLIPSRY